MLHFMTSPLVLAVGPRSLCYKEEDYLEILNVFPFDYIASVDSGKFVIL